MADFLDSLTGILEGAAPAVASMLGGPLAGTAVTWLEGQLGLTPPAGATQDNRLQAIGAAMQGLTGDQLIAMRKADTDFKAKLVDAGVLLEQNDEKDRESARAREVSLRDWATKVLAFFVIGAWVAIQWYTLTHVIPADERDIVMRGLGTLDTAVGLVLAYYFGSSSGHARATELLAQAGPNKG